MLHVQLERSIFEFEDFSAERNAVSTGVQNSSRATTRELPCFADKESAGITGNRIATTPIPDQSLEVRESRPKGED